MLTTPPYRIPQGTTIGCATCDYLLAMLSICKNKFASCFATSLGRHKLATSNLSAVCRVLRIALRTAILKKYNCRTAFERTSHNGLQTSGISVVILTLPVSLWYYHCTRKIRDICQWIFIARVIRRWKRKLRVSERKPNLFEFLRRAWVTYLKGSIGRHSERKQFQKS